MVAVTNEASPQREACPDSRQALACRPRRDHRRDESTGAFLALAGRGGALIGAVGCNMAARVVRPARWWQWPSRSRPPSPLHPLRQPAGRRRHLLVKKGPTIEPLGVRIGESAVPGTVRVGFDAGVRGRAHLPSANRLKLCRMTRLGRQPLVQSIGGVVAVTGEAGGPEANDVDQLWKRTG